MQNMSKAGNPFLSEIKSIVSKVTPPSSTNTASTVTPKAPVVVYTPPPTPKIPETKIDPL
jgi:hypothetical protein